MSRKIAEFSFNEKRAVVRRYAEWEEYIVRFYANGVHMDNSDYHTDDKEDALNTAATAVKEEREWCEANNLC